MHMIPSQLTMSHQEIISSYHLPNQKSDSNNPASSDTTGASQTERNHFHYPDGIKATFTPPKSYASRLTKNLVPYGATGLPETFDTKRVLRYKLSKLSQWVKESENIVFFTGSGLSTSCGIDDFRGSVSGVWTREERNEQVPEYDESFLLATPSLSHMAIYELSKHKNVHVVTQNVDDLHRRSGLDPNRIMELHGNLFVEECKECKKRFYRNFDVQGMGLKQTGRSCPQCGGALYDFCLDWLDALPDDDYEKSRQVCKEADLVICLGTSLRVEPANKIPGKTLKNGGKMVIINLQETPKDDIASMKINYLCDVILKEVMTTLGHQIPNYILHEEVKICVQRESVVGRNPKLPAVQNGSTKNPPSPKAAARSSPVETKFEEYDEPIIKKTVIKKRKRKNAPNPSSESAPKMQKSNQERYIVSVSKPHPIDRLVYCRKLRFSVPHDAEFKHQELYNHGVEHTFQFSYPTRESSPQKFELTVTWHPVCSESKETILSQSFSETERIHRVKIFDINFQNLTEEELIFRVPIARKRFYGDINQVE